MDRLKQLWATVQATRAWKAWSRYGDARGNLLAGGVTYFAFFSIFPALALGFTIFGLLLQDNPQWLDQIKDSLNTTLPGFIEDGDNGGLIPLTVPTGNTLTLTGLLGLGGLLVAGVGWLSALRDGIRSVFGAEGAPGNAVTAKIRDLGVLVLLGLAIVVSAAVTGLAGAATSSVAGAMGLGDQAWLLRTVALVIGVGLDGVVVFIMLRLLSGVVVPWRLLISGALIGGVGLSVLKLLGTTLIQSTKDNPVFASVALVVGLLAWLNFMSRIVLLAAAWGADTIALAGIDPAVGTAADSESEKDEKDAQDAQDAKATADRVAQAPHPSVPPESSPATRHADRATAPAATRADDRVTLALGAAVGCAATTGLALAAKTLRRTVRR